LTSRKVYPVGKQVVTTAVLTLSFSEAALILSLTYLVKLGYTQIAAGYKF